MKDLTYLDIADNEVGDLGIKEIIYSLKNYSNIENLDISGNFIGKSAYNNEASEALFDFLSHNETLEILKINWNNIRGHMGEKIIDGLIHSANIKEVHINNNLLGMAYEDK